MWIVTRRVRFKKREIFSGAFSSQGDSPLGLDGGMGLRLILGPARSWVGCFDEEKGRLAWAAGPKTRARGPVYIPADLKRPSWISPCRQGGFLVCNAGKGSLGILDPARGWRELVDLKKYGLSYPANSVIDSFGNIWVNDIYRAALWVFTGFGKLLRIIGDPKTPMDTGSTPAWGGVAPSTQEFLAEDDDAERGDQGARAAPLTLEEARLSAIWDIRAGKDGLVYILEGSALRLRAIDFQRGRIFLVAGSGLHGFTGDGGDPREAAFGRSGARRWDGPLAFCTDPHGRIFIADTKNGVIRMIDEDQRRITTIAGRKPGPAPGSLGPRGPARSSPAPDIRGPRSPARGRSLLDTLPSHGRREAGPTPGSDPLLLSLPSTFWLDWSSRGLSITDANGDVTVITEATG